jgi:hypothetical protein
MSEAELNQLERDVEQARERFTADLARMRSPSIYADFKDEVVAEIRHTKDDLVERTTDAATDRAHSILAEIKDRAAANPAAALAIGAGLAWHLARHPPVTSVLVGLGVMSLWRTNPQHPSRSAELVAQAKEIAGSVKESATELAGSVKDKVEQLRTSETAERASELAESVKEKVIGSAESVKEKVVGTAESLADRGTAVIHGALHEPDKQDSYLYGAAALALAAAVGIAVQRRMS